MSSWTNSDEAAGAPLWAGNQLGLAPSTSNRTDLFNDADADNFITGATIGLFNYKDGETQSGKIAHTGWNLKTTGSGGRSSRVSFECLVALANSQDA